MQELEETMDITEPVTSNELAGERTDLAVKRTAMAASRTMMAWIRTGTSLISFGFAIHKILQAAAETAATSTMSRLREHSARRLGLMLIFLGTASIVMGTFEYFSTARQLNAMSGHEQRVKWNLSLVIGALVALLGLFLFITILANREVL
jgi:putative membrane protein